MDDRRYLARCVTQLPQSSLEHLLGVLTTEYPNEVHSLQEYDGETTFYCDFVKLSSNALARVDNIVRKALKDDIEFDVEQAALALSSGKTMKDSKKRSAQDAAAMSEDKTSYFLNGPRVKRMAFDQTVMLTGINVTLKGTESESDHPWECTMCDKKFTSKDKIVQHLAHHTQDKVIPCPYCSHTFTNYSYVTLHIKRVHTHKCGSCDEKFLTSHALRMHAEENEHVIPNSQTKCKCTKGCSFTHCACFKIGRFCSDECKCKMCKNREAAVFEKLNENSTPGD